MIRGVVNIHAARRKPGQLSGIASVWTHHSGYGMPFNVEIMRRPVCGRIKQEEIITI